MKVLSFGEILWDIIEGKAHLGGAPLNFAAHSAQCGAESYMISRLGEDEYGQKAYKKLEELNVNISTVQFDSLHPTGTVEQQETPVPHAVLDVVAEYPQESHVAEQVHPAAVQKHGTEQGQPGWQNHQLGGEITVLEQYRRQQAERQHQFLLLICRQELLIQKNHDANCDDAAGDELKRNYPERILIVQWQKHNLKPGTLGDRFQICPPRSQAGILFRSV